MKITLYMDVYQGWNPQHACALTSPTWKIGEGMKRLAFDVEIPDYLIRPDVTMALPTVTAKEVQS